MGPLQERLQPLAPGPSPCEGRGGRRKLPGENAAALRRPRILAMESPRYCNSERSIQAYFSCVCRRWVSRSTEGSSLARSEEHTSELQSLMRISYTVLRLKKKK